jgi:hypothetical protein
MPAPKPACVTVFPWLKNNLGKNCLAPLTNTDWHALRAAVQCIELYSHTCDGDVLDAFARCVSLMQPHCWHLAYHSIAHVMDWGHRPQLWIEAGLPQPERLPLCAFEPASRTLNQAAA